MELKTLADEESAKVHVGFITLPASARLSTCVSVSRPCSSAASFPHPNTES